MKKIKIFLLSLASSIGAFAADVDVTPGQLESLLGDAADQTELKLKGSIDARDLAAFEKLPASVKSLDLSEVKIESLSMPTRTYFGRTLFSEGEIPAYTFFKSGITTLILPAETSVICEGAFAGSDIEAIVIPEGITSLGDYAFYGCPALKSVTLPSTLKQIGKGTFGNCMALESLDLSATRVTEIPERAFAGSMSLAEIKLPQGLEKVGREAFSYTKVDALDLSSVKAFEPYALSGMTFITRLSVNPRADIGDGLLMDNISLESLTGMPEMLPAYFAANCGSLDAADLIGSATSFGNYALANTGSSDNVTLSGQLTRVGRGAFTGLVSLKNIDATALGSNIPDADEFSFEGLDQPEITLWVTDSSFDDWKKAPYWNLFNLQASNETTITEITGDAGSAISITLHGGLIVIESPATVSDVRIYTSDGRMAYVASPSDSRVEIETASLPSGVLIVAASDSDGNTRNVSFLLK